MKSRNLHMFDRGQDIARRTADIQLKFVIEHLPYLKSKKLQYSAKELQKLETYTSHQMDFINSLYDKVMNSYANL